MPREEARPNDDEAPAAGEPGFDVRLAELEGIVEELERGGIALEPAIERYQRGIELLKQCHGTLERYRQRVEELTRDAELALRPFEGDPDAALDADDGTRSEGS